MYTLSSRVYTSHTGPDGVMKLAGAIEIIQDCSMAWMDSEPAFREYLRAHRLGMFLISRQADIRRLPHFDERITVRTGIFATKPFFGYRNTVLFGGDGRPCILTWCLGAFVNLETGRMEQLPREQRARITIDPKIDMEYLDRKIAVPQLPGRRLGPMPVRRDDIDMNRHMNNARYVRDALELLPESRRIRRLRVEYKRAAKLGDTLFPVRIDAPDGKCVILLGSETGEPYAVLEFS